MLLFLVAARTSVRGLVRAHVSMARWAVHALIPLCSARPNRVLRYRSFDPVQRHTGTHALITFCGCVVRPSFADAVVRLLFAVVKITYGVMMMID